MGEWWWAVAVAVALLSARWVGLRIGAGSPDDRRKVPDDLGPYPAVLFFSSPTCASCEPARSVVVAEAGDLVREHPWDIHPGILGRLRVDRVPTTWVVDAGGRVALAVEGVPAGGEVAAALANAGRR